MHQACKSVTKTPITELFHNFKKPQNYYFLLIYFEEGIKYLKDVGKCSFVWIKEMLEETSFMLKAM